MTIAEVLEHQMARTFDGTLVKKLREARGMTVTMLAALAGCTPQNITNIESGTQEPKGGLLGRLADALELRSVDAFYRVTK